MERLTQRAAPDVILGEPVGSCTDLRATVQYPLCRLYGDRYRVGPLSVLVDPLRALRMLGEESGRPFSPKVLYIYGKQLEEADLIVINKCDLLDGERVSQLERASARAMALGSTAGSPLGPRRLAPLPRRKSITISTPKARHCWDG